MPTQSDQSTGTVDPRPADGSLADGGSVVILLATAATLFVARPMVGASALSVSAAAPLAVSASFAGAASASVVAAGTMASPSGAAATISLVAQASFSAPLRGAATIGLNATCYLPYRIAASGSSSIAILPLATLSVAQGTASDLIRFLAFGPRDEGLLWLRNSGSVDATEWDPGALAYVQGTSRDGGTAMPEGYWESARLDANMRRFTRIESEREGFGPLSFVAKTERNAGEGAASAQGVRWARFSPRMEGRTHRIRVRVPETVTGVSSLDMVFNGISGPRK